MLPHGMTTLLEAIANGQVHREEMNLIEHPVGIVSDRVPINPATGQEYKEIRFEQERAGSGNLDSGAEWSFCLTAARLAAGQER
jgi:hypothetical protein